jgi:hypothetical protein
MGFFRINSLFHHYHTRWFFRQGTEIQVWLKRHKRFSLRMRLFEGIRRSWTLSMSDPRTGGVTQAPRKKKKNGVKNLKGVQATPEFHRIKNGLACALFFCHEKRSDVVTSSFFDKRIFDFLALPY